MTVAIITARMGSSRLPGKAMLDLAGAPMLQRMVGRVRHAALVEDIVVATTTDPADDILEDLCRTIGCSCFRGAKDDVLDRVLKAAEKTHASEVVHLTGDCPYIDPVLIDQTILFFRRNALDYAGNNLNGTFPIGLDVRMFSLAVLRDVAARTQDHIDRAHVTYYMYKHPEIYAVGGWDAPAGTDSHFRLTVDEFLDYKLARFVFEAFKDTLETFTTEQMLSFLVLNSEMAAINSNVRQKKPEEC